MSDFLGDNISSYDVTSYAFISCVIHSNLGPILKAETLKYKNLTDYDVRLYSLLFKA
ncbi:hypothetical protein N9O57_01260 [bacterium]|nr:hypothetical protein [bacterium]